MANPTAPGTHVNIKGIGYTLAWDFQAVADAEELLGRSLITGLRQKDFEAPAVKLVQAMLYACLKKNHPAITFPEAKTLVTMKNIGKVWSAVTDAWVAAMSEPDEDTSGEAAVQS